MYKVYIKKKSTVVCRNNYNTAPISKIAETLLDLPQSWENGIQVEKYLSFPLNG